MSDFKQTGPFSRQAAANVEAVPGQIWGLLQGVGRKLGRAGQYLSSEKAAQDYTNLLSGQLPQIGRAAVAAPTGQQGPTQDVYLQPGIGYFDRRSGRFIGPENERTVVSGLDGAGNVDRRKSDTYKQYAQTPEGQFERYFKTPEMDQYFGAASRGKGAPADVGQMKALAGELTAPQDVPLSSYYRAQSAMGRAQMPEIQKGLGYAEGSDLAKWAAANPMLAQRLYAKKQAAAPTEAPVTPGYEAGAQPLSDIDSFSMAANGVPAPWNTQGEKVSAEFSGVVPFQAAKTTGEGMPAFQTTGEKAAEFLKRPNIRTLF